MISFFIVPGFLILFWAVVIFTMRLTGRKDRTIHPLAATVIICGVILTAGSLLATTGYMSFLLRVFPSAGLVFVAFPIILGVTSFIGGLRNYRARGARGSVDETILLTAAMSGKLVRDANGLVVNDLACVHCGYNLLGCSADGLCPECETPVARSGRGDRLRFADPAWVGRLELGTNFIIAGVVASFLVSAGTATLALVRVRMSMLTQLLSLVPGLLYLIGYWKTTAPNPARLDDESAWSARNAARFLQVAAFAAAVFRVSFRRAFPGITHVLLFVDVGMVLAAEFAVLLYARGLALRVPDKSLARQTRIVMWGVLGFGAFQLAVVEVMRMYVVPRFSQGPNGMMQRVPPASTILTYDRYFQFLEFARLGATVFNLWAVMLILRYRVRFKIAAEDARRTWESETSGATVEAMMK